MKAKYKLESGFCVRVKCKPEGEVLGEDEDETQIEGGLLREGDDETQTRK